MIDNQRLKKTEILKNPFIGYLRATISLNGMNAIAWENIN